MFEKRTDYREARFANGAFARWQLPTYFNARVMRKKLPNDIRPVSARAIK
jgi:hypothetical protein